MTYEQLTLLGESRRVPATAIMFKQIFMYSALWPNKDKPIMCSLSLSLILLNDNWLH